ncbi:hypothetical protein [Noviluteimonas dokdonensis]|uniref:hypothetical protein n=1 Tax=Noviluteimonas dokdonensis TaxID=414050 RepID=UPI001269F6C6|nr:hypothetical protein [Lysobacter dokdonensis]
MAITKHNEINELMNLAFGYDWIELGMTSDTTGLEAAASYSQSVAENCFRARDTLDAYRLGIEIDSDEWDYTINVVSKLLGEAGSIALHVERTSSTFLRAPALQTELQRSAERHAARLSGDKEAIQG